MGGDRRAVSTVVDVSMGILVIVAAMGVLVVFAETDEREHDPTEAEYAAQTVAGSTVSTTYTLAPALDDYFRAHRGVTNPYEDEELERVSHGPIATQVADLAVGMVAIDGEQLSAGATDYERALEETLWTRLRGSQFELSIGAHWQPVEGVSLKGTTVLGETPPRSADVSTTTLTVPSGLPDTRQRAVEAVDGPDDYASVARTVANTTIAGLFPSLETQRALERAGSDYHRTRYRYERLAAILDGDWAVFERQDWLSPSTADVAAANAYLSHRLATLVEPQLADSYENAHDAARAVSTETVTLTIRTWTDE